MYDIAVIGLGPAGASFARLVDSQRYRVVAFDRKDTQQHFGGFRKPCGGLLSPGAQRALAKFNLSIPGHIIASPQIFYVKTIDMDSHLQSNYQRFYLNIDRHKFDLWLMSLIPDTVTVYEHSSVTQIDHTDGFYTITYNRGKIKETVRARYLIDAGGALSVVSRKFLNKDMRTYRLSIQEWSPHHAQAQFFSCLFDSENCDSYAWSLSKDGAFIFGGAYDIKTAKHAFDAQKQKLKSIGICTHTPVRREACLVCRLRSHKDFRLGRGHVFALGEAAGFVSPSSFEGISGALDSAYLLSRVFNNGEDDILARYQKATRRLRAKLVAKIIKSRILGHRLLRRLIMKSGIKNITLIEQQTANATGYDVTMPPISDETPH